MKKLFFVLFIFISACSEKEENMPEASQIDFAYSRLTFQCAYESDSLPELNREADILYQYSLYLEKIKGKKNYTEIGRYYRIAAAHDHFKAAANLQFLLSSGLVSSPGSSMEAIDLAEYYIARGIPGGYYDMAHYLELGYGVKQDVAASRAYFRRAADMGSPEAQYYIANLLGYVPNAADAMLAMYKCAMEQGSENAARKYANYLKELERFNESLQGYQVATKNGDYMSAYSLAGAFEGPPVSDELYYLGLEKDTERVARYKSISDFLTRHEHLGAKIPDIDSIVPLPPAVLPEWDGTFQWQRERDSYVPVIPSPELIEKLSAEKGLDPATGLPLSATKT